MTLIAEDLLLLLLDDEKGDIKASTHLRVALGGALLIELALDESVEVEEKGSIWRTTKVHTTGRSETDPLLVAALATVAEKDRSAQDLVNRLGKDVKDPLIARLVEREIVREDKDRVLGLFPRTRWPAIDSTHEDGVRRQLTAVLVSGAQPDPRTGALVALLHAIGRAEKTVPHEGMSGGEVRKRAKQVAEGAWAAKAVKDAIAAANAAVMAAVISSSAATSAST